ncbi:hypothetical protein ABZX85_25525 [Streptomyces sp. NPDC004539]|uniref:hypothetical protein n=1 Tax=Streptomyces sp. NPDC004539 TaxID=3154280 RepID=UPI00339F1A89
MSLTHCLNDRRSPLRLFLDTELPDVAAPVGDYRSRLPQLPDVLRPHSSGPIDHQSLGQAIDLRLRIAFGSPVPSTVVTGIGLAAMQLADTHSCAAALALAETAKELLAQLSSQPPALPGALLGEAAAEEHLARLCFVAAWFEAVARAGLRQGSPLLRADLSHGLDGLLDQVPSYVPGDLTAQAALADRPGALRWVLEIPLPQRVCGPVFAGSHDVGGGDADFIAAGCLIDCKSTIHPERIGRSHLYQLAGYLLLDYDNAYGIDRVGLYLSRQGRLIDWETGHFLQLLGARRTLPELRRACRTALADSPEAG